MGLSCLRNCNESLPMYIVEFIGSLVVTCTFALVTQPNLLHSADDNHFTRQESFIAPVAVGFSMISMIYAFGHVSGAHFNPSVSMAVYIRGFISRSDLSVFIFVQLIGSFVGALISYSISGEMPFVEPGNDYKDQYGRTFIVELIYSFAISLVVINVATTESQRGNFFYGVSIGMIVCAGIASGQRISGGCFNPAIGTALSVTNYMRDDGTIRFIWIYWVAPMIGGILGGSSYYVLNAKEIERMKLIRQQEGRQFNQ